MQIKAQEHDNAHTLLQQCVPVRSGFQTPICLKNFFLPVLYFCSLALTHTLTRLPLPHPPFPNSPSPSNQCHLNEVDTLPAAHPTRTHSTLQQEAETLPPTPSTPPMNMRHEEHIVQLTTQLNTLRQQNSHLLEQVQQQQELLNRLACEDSTLQQRSTQQDAPTPSSPSPSVAMTLDNNPPPSPPPQPTLAPPHQHHFDQQLNPKARKQHQATVRALSPPSDNQGFQYIYLHTRNRLPIGQVRKNFHAIKVDTNRLLDLHYPVNSVLAILIHNDYTNTFMTQITKIGLTTMSSFNPCDPAHLHNPKYKALTTNQRQVQQKQTVRIRMLRTLDHLRLPVRNAVAKYYLTAGWILNMNIAKAPRPTIPSSAPQQRQQQHPSPQHRPPLTFSTETSAERDERHSSPAYQALPPSAKAFADSCFSLSTI